LIIDLSHPIGEFTYPPVSGMASFPVRAVVVCQG
jgi:hypothetical protein